MIRKALFMMCAAIVAVTCAHAQTSDPSGSTVRTIDSVYFLSQKDELIPATLMVGEFTETSDWTVDWRKQRRRIMERAKEKGANLVFIKMLGWDKRGHAFYASGTFCYADSAVLQRVLSSYKHQDDCAVVIFRDNGPSLATYKYDVTVNEEQFRDFSDMSYIRKHIDSCEAPVFVKINRHSEKIPLGGHTRYFRLIKNAGIAAIGPMIFIYPGGYTLQEIQDEELAGLFIGRLKRYQP